MSPAEMRAKADALRQRRVDAFDEFMALPTTQLAMSLIPAANPPETLRVLMQSCFEAGCGWAIGDLAMSVFTKRGD
jgi:hypothetical protein